jgi:hypothetical protein
MQERKEGRKEGTCGKCEKEDEECKKEALTEELYVLLLN